MKRIFAIVLMLLLICGTACAEKFTLHNGTSFGMTAQDVIKLEQEKGFFQDADAESMARSMLRASGTFAGRENGEMCYAFDDDKELVQFHYTFKDGSLEEYAGTENSLIAKYGKPDYSSEECSFFPVELKWYPQNTEDMPIIWNGFAPMTGKSLDNTRMKEFMFDLLGTRLYNYQDYTCTQYSQWLVRNKDGSAVLIDHSYMHVSSFQSESPVSKKTNLHQSDYELVTYTAISTEELEALDAASEQAMDDL